MENPSLSKNQSLLCHQSNSHQDTPILDTTAIHSSPIRSFFFFLPFQKLAKRGLKQATLTREFKTTRCHDTPETKRPGYRLQEKFFVINVSLPAHIRTYPILGRRTPFLITATNRADGGRSNKLSWNIDPLLSLSLSLRRIIIKVPTSVAGFERITLPSALLPTSLAV